MKEINYFDSYGVFCIAMNLPDDELDVRWWKAVLLYKEFLTSRYNDFRYSELDCIYEFLEYKKESIISEQFLNKTINLTT